MNSGAWLKAWLPPALERMLRRVSPRATRLVGPYATWADAIGDSRGYAESNILERVAAAQHAVMSGQACYERDGVLFQTPSYEFPLISVIQRAALENGGAVTVLDYGGSLGTTYRRNRPALDGITRLNWQVAEQSHFVERGQQDFSNDELNFVSDIQRCDKPDVVLLCGVLHVLEAPYPVLEELAGLAPAYLVLDRTAFTRSGAEAVMLQKVPAKIYEAQYPSWVLSWDKVSATLDPEYELVCQIPTLEDDVGHGNLIADYRGGIFRRRA